MPDKSVILLAEDDEDHMDSPTAQLVRSQVDLKSSEDVTRLTGSAHSGPFKASSLEERSP